MNPRQPSTRPLTVRIFVFPGVRLLDVTGPIEVFTSANDFGGRYRLELVSADGRDVTTAGGTRLGADLAVGDLRPAVARRRTGATRGSWPCGSRPCRSNRTRSSSRTAS